MKQTIISIIEKELLWFVLIAGVSVLIEFVFITFSDLHPGLRTKVQSVIGLMLIGYSIRLTFRMMGFFVELPGSRKNDRKF